MKKVVISIIIVMMGGVYYTGVAQRTPSKPEYVFPEGMSEKVREQNIVNADKGYAIYQMVCSKCHVTKVKGKDIIPDFTVEQLETYQIRIANATHETELQETSLTAEELSLVTTFFTYKKKVKK